MSTTKADSLGYVKDHATQLFQSIIEQATSRAMNENLSTAGKAKRKVTSKFHKSSPTVRDIALNAASGAIELWQAARDRAEDTIETVQATVSDSASDVLSGVSDLKSGAADRVHNVSAAVGSAVGSSAQRAADSSKAAVSTSATAGRNTLGFVVWTGIAGAIAYYAFLDEDRRAKARDLAMRVINEGRGLLGDIQGHDGEFAPQ